MPPRRNRIDDERLSVVLLILKGLVKVRINVSVKLQVRVAID